jgi:vacuolar-type H+-ATPase subunit I/STV1
MSVSEYAGVYAVLIGLFIMAFGFFLGAVGSSRLAKQKKAHFCPKCTPKPQEYWDVRLTRGHK